MRKIFIGMLFIFINFTITLDNITIGLIPTFIGYVFVMSGLDELSFQSGKFAKVKPHAKVMAIYTAALYAMDIFGITNNIRISLDNISGIIGGDFVVIILGIISICITLYIFYYVIEGVYEIERNEQCFLNSTILKKRWLFVAVMQIAAYSLITVPVVNIIAIIAGFIGGVCFIISFNYTKKLYEKRPVNMQSPPLYKDM